MVKYYNRSVCIRQHPRAQPRHLGTEIVHKNDSIFFTGQHCTASFFFQIHPVVAAPTVIYIFLSCSFLTVVAHAVYPSPLLFQSENIKIISEVG